MASNDYFSFKQFTVAHNLCAMKVGTDGVLLGAWAEGGNNILDVGCGSGLIALMMAQRFKDSRIRAIDIDNGAFRQAVYNAELSPFANRIDVENLSLQDFTAKLKSEDNNQLFDAIVCNPPFFANSLKNPDRQRALARHSDSLPFDVLFSMVAKLLVPNGAFSVILPADCKNDFIFHSALNSLQPTRVCAIKPNEKKAVKRIMMTFRNGINADCHDETHFLSNADGSRSEWYQEITKDFYLR